MLSNILTALVAIEHLYILYMEMFAWETRGKVSLNRYPSIYLAQQMAWQPTKDCITAF